MKHGELRHFNYEDNKKQIFDKLISNIETGIQKNLSQFFIKKLLIVDEEIDVIGKRADWPDSLNKALVFYKSIEDYESCAKCQTLIDQLNSTNKKTTKKNGRKTS